MLVTSNIAELKLESAPETDWRQDAELARLLAPLLSTLQTAYIAEEEDERRRSDAKARALPVEGGEHG